MTDKKKIVIKHAPIIVLFAVFGGSLLNLALFYFVEVMQLPVFLDSIFTIMVTAVFGIWPGIVVGFLTNAGMEVLDAFSGTKIPFAAVNILTAILTALLVRKGFFDSIPGILVSVMIIALANALAGAFIVTLVFGGTTDESVDQIVRAITVTGKSLFTSAFLGRILINVVDKGLSLLIVYPVYKRLRRWNETTSTAGRV